MARLTDEQRADLLADLQGGMAVRVAAARYGCHPSTASRLAAAAGIECNVAQTKMATAARKDWAAAERKDLLNRLFDKADGMLRSCRGVKNLKSLATTVAILIDKRRLEDGEVTARTEVTGDGDEARERIARRIDELAARRREKGAA
jgi:transposase